MNTNGNEYITPVTETPDCMRIIGGLTKRELMAIEFTKSLLGLRHFDNQPIYDLSKRVYSPEDDFCSWKSQQEADEYRLKEAGQLTEKALFIADALIDALNKSKPDDNH